MQSSNDAPWYATSGADAPAGREGWPSEVVPADLEATPRGRRLSDLLARTECADERELARIAFDTLCPRGQDLRDAVERGWDAHGDGLAAVSPDVRFLDRTLRTWDGRADVGSEGMTVLFHLRRVTDLPWPVPGATLAASQMRAYLEDLAKVAATMRACYADDVPDPLRVPWGMIHFLERGGRRFPLAGGTIEIPALLMAHAKSEGGRDRMTSDGLVPCVAGSSFVHGHLLEREGRPGIVRDWAVTPVGQIDPAWWPRSPHVVDQTELYARGQWAPLRLSRQEVEMTLCPHAGRADHEHPARTTLRLRRP